MRNWVVALFVMSTVTVATSASGQMSCDSSSECIINEMCSEQGECLGTPVTGGSCDDSNECTISDTCTNGFCQGTPRPGGSCDDFSECTVNDTCTNGFCQGTPGGPGMTCGQFPECQGLCQGGFCAPQPENEGMPCDDGFGACSDGGRCFATFCVPQPIQCPDDGDPCTLEGCNPFTGECEVFEGELCPDCQVCESVVKQPGQRDGGAGPQFQCVPFMGELPTATPTGTPTNSATSISTDTPIAPPTDVPTMTATTPASGTPTETVAPPPTSTGQPPPSPTPMREMCASDCNGDDNVAVNEMVICVNIALGSFEQERCLACDSNGDGATGINDLIAGVGNLLNGCPA